MKKVIFILYVLFPLCLQAQDFEKSFEEFQKSINQNFNNFNDSINTVFAKALEKQWQEFQVFAKVPVPVKPNPKTPPVAPPPKNEPEKPVETPIKNVDPPQKEEPKPELPIFKEEPKPELPIIKEEPKPELPIIKEEPKPVVPEKTPINNFYKTIRLWNFDFKITYNIEFENLFLANTQEKTIADFWRNLSHTDFQPIVNEIVEITKKCNLNHYGVALLCHKYAKSVWENKPNEAAAFFVFLLNQFSMDAKIVRTSNRLEPVIHSPQKVYEAPYLEIERKKYYFLFSSNEPTSIFTYKINFSDKIAGLDFNVYKPVKITDVVVNKEFPIKKLNKNVKLTYSQSAIDYYKNYPQVDAHINTNAAVSDEFQKSVVQQFKPLLEGKTEYEAVDILLNFMHYAFDYKTDDEHFGREKWNFCEENLYYPFNDCDDRAILFSYLVRELVHLDVVLLLFSDHISAAVHFNTPVTGDYITVDGQQFIICDPTYIGATIGMNMIKYKNQEAEIVRTKKL